MEKIFLKILIVFEKILLNKSFIFEIFSFFELFFFENFRFFFSIFPISYPKSQGFTECTDVNGGFCIVYDTHNRLYLFGSNQRNEIIQTCQEFAAANLCIGLKRIKPGISNFDFQSKRMGDYSTDEALTSYVEFR